MQLSDIKSETKSLLYKHYKIRSNVLPEPRAKAKWKSDNKYGFFMGILEYGEQAHIHQMHQLHQNEEFEKEQEFSPLQSSAPAVENHDTQTYISRMFDYYILPFNQNYNNNTGNSQSPRTSGASSTANSTEDLASVREHDLIIDNNQLESHMNIERPGSSSSSTPPRPSSSSNSSHRRLTQNSLKKALIKRDGVCLFCWRGEAQHAAHIIAQKNTFVSIDRAAQLQNAGLIHEHQVQNGLLLCNYCHDCFDKLKYYVDVNVDNQLVVKVVNESNDPKSEKHLDWEISVSTIHSIRCHQHRRWITVDNRQPKERNGEMALYFLSNNSEELPNRTALQFHKTACLIWRMAGGAVDDDESSDEDNDDNIRVVPITYNRKNVQQWINSNATLMADTHK